MTTVYKTPTKNNKSALVKRLKDYFEVEFVGILKGRAKLTKVGEYKTANYQDAKKMADKYMTEISSNTLKSYVDKSKISQDKSEKALSYSLGHGRLSIDSDHGKKMTKKITNRKQGRLNALDRIMQNESKNTPYVKPFNDTDGNHKGYKALNKHGKLKFFRKEAEAAARKHAGLDEETLNESTYATYHNTPEMAKKIGWGHFPEYCFGDKKAKYVLHNHHKGTFHYTNDKGSLKEETLDEKVWFDKRSGDKTGSEHIDKHKKILRKNLRKNRKRVKEALGMNEETKPTLRLYLSRLNEGKLEDIKNLHVKSAVLNQKANDIAKAHHEEFHNDLTNELGARGFKLVSKNKYGRKIHQKIDKEHGTVHTVTSSPTFGSFHYTSSDGHTGSYAHGLDKERKHMEVALDNMGLK